MPDLWYRATKFADRPLHTVVVVRETHKTLTIELPDGRTRRVLKRTDANHSYFRSFGRARDWLVAHAKAEVERAEIVLSSRRERLAKMRAASVVDVPAAVEF